VLQGDVRYGSEADICRLIARIVPQADLKHECLILLLHLDRFDGAGESIANKSGSLIELSVGRGTGTMNFRAKASAERR
jgi:hypothetical protein